MSIQERKKHIRTDQLCDYLHKNKSNEWKMKNYKKKEWKKKHKSGAIICFFTCGRVGGMVAESLSEKMLNHKPYGTPVVSEVIRSDNGEHMLIMHEQGDKKNTIVSF